MRVAIRKFGLDSNSDVDPQGNPPRAKTLGLHPSTDATSVADVRVLVPLPRTEQARREQANTAARFDRICASMRVSNRAIARRLGVTEKIVRDYRLGLRRIPSDIWTRIGRSLAEAFLVQLLARVRGESP